MVGCIIQARMSSTRMPEKVLKSLPFGSDITILQQVIRRVKQSALVDQIIVATTIEPEDEKIVEIAKKENVRWFRGSKENVLERYYLAAKENNLDHIVRVTSDCPCLDPEIISTCIQEHLSLNVDYSSNSYNNRFIRGLDMEVIKFEALENAFENVNDNFQKEHVSTYIYKYNPEKFTIHTVSKFDNYFDSNIRITVDTLEDYALVCAVYDYLYFENKYFGISEIVELFKNKPWLKLINSSTPHKKVFNSIQEEVDEAIKIMDYYGMMHARQLITKG